MVRLLTWVRDFAFLLVATMTVLFFLVRLAGDPAIMLAGPDATPAQLDAVRHAYGFDRGLFEQYLIFALHLLRLDFGASLVDGTPALAKVLETFPASLYLAVMAMGLNLAVSIPVGAWLGQAQGGAARRVAHGILSVMQGFPGFVLALLLVNVFAVGLEWLPAVGYAGPASWVLPVISVASFLAPKLIRVIEANATAAYRSHYVRTAVAIGAGPRTILWRHVMPNALLGAAAVVGAEFAFMVTGLVVIETIFAWPGIGWLLVRSTLNLDFPVVQAIVFIIVIAVFLTNAATEAVQVRLDPRLRGPGAAGGGHG
ncbi:ABC transporter permease [Niveispirillum sp.]|uniref:ABC transporter permease n=1 Tax=Niveispirillum sp. TaxID=1917217 RepID=UPI001B7C31DD|nr:ABC transporter permease [Niveispirillum sp.]MBP7335588.1 ABC transporter permease [Niveispirillum sp.]